MRNRRNFVPPNRRDTQQEKYGDVSNLFDKIDLNSNYEPEERPPKISVGKIGNNGFGSDMQSLIRRRGGPTASRGSQSNFSQNQSQNTMRQLQFTANRFNHHPIEWWEDSGRRELLKRVFCQESDDSENDAGQPVFKLKKDPNYLQDQKQI